MSDYVEATFYIQIVPEWGHTPPGYDHPVLRGAKAVAMTQKRPSGRQRPGTVMAPITLRIPKAAFTPLSPKIVVTIPEDMCAVEPVEALVEG